MNTYKAFYKGRTMELQAETQLKARDKAAEALKARKAYDVSVVLLAVGEREIVHAPQDVCP